MVTVDESKVAESVRLSRSLGCPVLICLIATKACYIKFAGLVHALVDSGYPFLAIETGQHYEPFLRDAAQELGYRQHLAGGMEMAGDLLDKSSSLFANISLLAKRLSDLDCRSALLAVCGDTLTAAIGPFAWYMATGQRSVHVEAGLRSMRPKWEWCRDLLHQRNLPWESIPTRPFPEGLCTRIASIASQHLFAPVERNNANLLAESYNPSSIHISGSPSVDAVRLAMERCKPLPSAHSVRVDIHRRENLTRERLDAIFGGVIRLAHEGIPIDFILTKSMQACEGVSWDRRSVKQLEKAGIRVGLQAQSYVSVVQFLLSKPLAIMTDSGGFQEECTMLGVPCMTVRFETDRPETVLEFGTNILIPPTDPESIASNVITCLSSKPDEIWPGLGKSSDCYGSNVGRKIVKYLKHTAPEPSHQVALK